MEETAAMVKPSNLLSCWAQAADEVGQTSKQH